MLICSIQDQGQKTSKTVLKLMHELREGGRVDVDVKPLCIFLFKNGGPFSLSRLDPFTDLGR